VAGCAFRDVTEGNDRKTEEPCASASAEVLTKEMKPHTIGEILIRPAYFLFPIYFNCKWVFTCWQWYYIKTQHTNNTPRSNKTKHGKLHKLLEVQFFMNMSFGVSKEMAQ
jgi:hypothetical protein